MIERWLRLPVYRDELAGAGIGRDEDSIRAATAAQLAAMQPLAETVFNNFLDLVGRPCRRTTLFSQHAID
jgi:GMP synthase (glutamine-hydrolysing)